nr:hypothetical protein [Tanacetum cinerariifolium]
DIYSTVDACPNACEMWKAIERKSTNLPTTTFELHQTPVEQIRIILQGLTEALGIDNDIYSTVDACPNACEMWKAIERLKQGESINVQDIETNLYWEFGKFTSQDDESLESYYSRSQQTVTRNRGKAIVNSPQPIYDQEPSMVAEDDETSKDKEIDKLMALIFLSFKKVYKPTNNNLRTSSNTSRANQDNSPRINRSTGYENQRIGNVAGARETVGTGSAFMYMAQIQEISPDAANSGPIFDVEPLQKVSNDDHYNVFSIESAHPEQYKSVYDTYLIEHDAHNMITDSLDMSYDREEIDQNDDNNDLDNERELLASLIEKLKCEIDESKNRNKFLETSNKSEAKLARHNSVEYALKMEIECAQVRGDLISYKIESQKSFNKYTQTINNLNQTILEMKNKLSTHQETISILSQQKEAHIKLYKTREDKELDKVIALENKVKVLDNIVYKTGQSVQTMNMLNNKCRTSFAKLEFLKKAKRANPCLYDIGCYNDNIALMLAPESDEVIRLEKESRSKLSNLIRPFDYEKLNNLYDLFVPQHEKSSEQRYFLERSRLSHTSVNNGNSKESFNKQTILLEKQMDESIPWDKKCKSSIKLFKIKTYVDTIFDGVERCKEIITHRTYSGYLDPFIQNMIEANFSHEIKRINAGLKQFHVCLNEEMVADLRYFNSLELEVDSLRSQLETGNSENTVFE